MGDGEGPDPDDEEVESAEEPFDAAPRSEGEADEPVAGAESMPEYGMADDPDADEAEDEEGDADGLADPNAGQEIEHEVPPVHLLSAPDSPDRASMERQLDELGRILIEKLETFNIKSSLRGRTTGPMVTQFEVVPAPGVKVGRISSLDADLALAMKARTIRIVAPIPGKGAIGVEIPNPSPEIVNLSGDPGGTDLPSGQGRAPVGPRQGSQRAALRVVAGKDAARVDRGRDRRREVGMSQYHRDQPGLPAHARDPPAAHDRPEDGRALGLLTPSAPAPQRGHRPPRRRRCTESGRCWRWSDAIRY